MKTMKILWPLHQRIRPKNQAFAVEEDAEIIAVETFLQFIGYSDAQVEEFIKTYNKSGGVQNPMEVQEECIEMPGRETVSNAADILQPLPNVAETISNATVTVSNASVTVPMLLLQFLMLLLQFLMLLL